MSVQNKKIFPDGEHVMRYVNEPTFFFGYPSTPGGDLGEEAADWIETLERLKSLAQLSNTDAIQLAGGYLKDKAKKWYKVIGTGSSDWVSFVKAFKNEFIADQEDRWWQALHALKQGPEDTGGDITVQMQELFGLLQNDNDLQQVRIFLSAIDPRIAYEIG